MLLLASLQFWRKVHQSPPSKGLENIWFETQLKFLAFIDCIFFLIASMVKLVSSDLGKIFVNIWFIFVGSFTSIYPQQAPRGQKTTIPHSVEDFSWVWDWHHKRANRRSNSNVFIKQQHFDLSLETRAILLKYLEILEMFYQVKTTQHF